MKRASLSKRTRFRIFQRDSFTCQYCGVRPPDVVLQLDHIHPVSKGGEDTEDNLTTSCVACNAGKTNKILGLVIPRPDADLQFLEAQQEIAEARRFLEAQSELVDLRVEIVKVIQAHWRELLGSKIHPAEHVILEWISRYSPDEITQAIDRLPAGMRRNPWRLNEDKFNNLVSYAAAIMRNRREDAA